MIIVQTLLQETERFINDLYGKSLHEQSFRSKNLNVDKLNLICVISLYYKIGFVFFFYYSSYDESVNNKNVNNA